MRSAQRGRESDTRSLSPPILLTRETRICSLLNSAEITRLPDPRPTSLESSKFAKYRTQSAPRCSGRDRCPTLSNPLAQCLTALAGHCFLIEQFSTSDQCASLTVCSGARLRYLLVELRSFRSSGLVRGVLSDGFPFGLRLRWSRRPRCSSDRARCDRDPRVDQTRFS